MNFKFYYSKSKHPSEEEKHEELDKSTSNVLAINYFVGLGRLYYYNTIMNIKTIIRKSYENVYKGHMHVKGLNVFYYFY